LQINAIEMGRILLSRKYTNLSNCKQSGVIYFLFRHFNLVFTFVLLELERFMIALLYKLNEFLRGFSRVTSFYNSLEIF
jgi:hypothetical protein